MDTANDGSFIWDVPNVTRQMSNFKVKIVLKDATGNIVGSDVNDGFFTSNHRSLTDQAQKGWVNFPALFLPGN
jgi:hypothetical protein